MSARLLRAGFAALCTCSLAACSGDPHSVVLFTLESTRADAVGTYGGPLGLTPHLDRLADEGVVYERAHTVAPLTLVAHASILSGLYPPRHGVRDDGAGALPGSAVTIAERARESGCQTAAFLGSAVLDQGFGLEQGFERYEPPARSFARRGQAQRSAAETVDLALEWLAVRDRERPFFLWVHLVDPHAPHDPEPEYLARAGNNAYLGEVAAADAALGRVIEALRAEEALDDVLVVAVGDHGEAFDEHDETSHGSFVYETTLRVPLIVRFPDGDRDGERSRETVTVADVCPTALEALGLDPEDEELDGLSLFEEQDSERGVYFESYRGYFAYGWHPLGGWLDERGKYVHSSRPRYFDLVRDPNELEDVAAAHAEDCERARAAIEELARRPPLAQDGPGTRDSELARALQALAPASQRAGAPVPAPLSALELPDPAERSAELREFQRAQALLDAEDWAAAERVLSELVRRNPHHLRGLECFGLCRVRTGRYREAIEPLERVLAEGPERADTWAYLGACRIVAGEEEKALGAFRRALEVDPNHVQALGAIVQLLDETGFAAKAALFRERFEAVQMRP